MGALLLRTITDRSAETDQGGFVLDLLRLSDRVVDSGKVAISKFVSNRPVYGNAQAHLSPSSTCKVCQPYAWKRSSTFSVNATSVSPSIEMSTNQSALLRRGVAANKAYGCRRKSSAYNQRCSSAGSDGIATYHNEVAQLQVTSKGSCFACNTLHETAITEEYCTIV